MKRNLVWLAALAALGCAVGSSMVRTVTAAPPPNQGVVIGAFDATATKAPNDSPTLYVTITTPKGDQIQVEMVDKGALKSSFWIALPPGKYKFDKGTAGGSAGTARMIKEWADANVYFEVRAGETACIGTVEAKAADSTAEVVQGAMGTFKGGFGVKDECAETTKAFQAAVPGVGGEVKTDLAKPKQ